MGKIRIITDSANDLPDEYLKRYDIQFAPLSITFEKETFYDRVSLTREEFYQRLQTEDKLPTTSQPSPKAFFDLMKKVLDEECEAIVITLSSGLSGSYNSACIAKDMFSEREQKRIHLIDSLTASIGQGLLVLKTARLAEKGEDTQTIVKTIQEHSRCIKSVFTVDTFEYLLKGGRVTKVQAFIGKVLDIKPILQLDSKGKIIPMEKARGKKKALGRMLEILQEKGDKTKNFTVGISHFLAENDATRIATRMKERFYQRSNHRKFSASIGTHVGPGCIAVFFYS